MKTTIFDLFSFFQDLTLEEQNKIQYLSVKNGQTILSEGDICDVAAFLYEGELKVSKIHKNGREINLYRVKPGQACILTIASALSNQHFPAFAVAVRDSKLFLIEKQLLKTWMARHFSLQEFIYQTTANRFTSMMGLIDDLFFRRIDERVVDFLLENFQEDEAVIYITHEELASELGTSREVISRVMKQLEKSGCIWMARGKISLKSREQLRLFLTKM